ncbi:MAG: hypothetical protein LBN27_03505 [Prevotellaceae bacterium]|jgi:hypothetical protein|nr:hypothetical protein [Prevotellaceae bacterium]
MDTNGVPNFSNKVMFWYKKIWKIYPLLLILSIILFFELKWCHEGKVLFNSSLNNKVIEVKHNWSGGRSYDYITDNGIVITLLNRDTLLVGDSISKEADTFKFDVYRKKNEKYEFYKTYPQ